METEERSYLWQHFVFNAEQRLKAFNFFVVFSVFANGGVFAAADRSSHGVVFLLIGGFIVTGTQPKKVIIRAIGTSLPLADKLADPTLELHGPNGLIEANDNWVDSPNKQAIMDSGIPPANDLESAIVANLPANGASYTAIVRGVNNTTGIAVVEVYALP